MFGIVGQENDSTERFRFALGFDEKNDRAIGFSNEGSRHISEERPEHHFLLQRARYQQIDFVGFRGLEDRHGRIFALLVMNGGILGKREREQRFGDFFFVMTLALSD